MVNPESIIIIANGRFPTAEHCLEILDNATLRICCDEAADSLIAYGLSPDIIIGDMDSVSEETLQCYSDRAIHISEQETNDLTKAIKYCSEKGYTEVTILGATGLREDHALGNISLLLEYNQMLKARMISDHGEFSIIKSGERVASFPGEQISFFSIDNQRRVTSYGLKYPLKDMPLHNWWRASLNEVTEDSFKLEFEGEESLILYRVINS